MKYVIIGGVAGGATAAARLRRIDEQAEIILLEKGKYIFLCQLRITLLYRRRYRRARKIIGSDSRIIR